MGFLDNLLKRETRKIISGATISQNSTVKRRESEEGDDADCNYDIETIRRRIAMVVAQDWSSYELRRDIPAENFGGSKYDHGFDYGLYLDGQPKLMIMILDQYQYRNKSVQNAHAACKRQGVASFHLLAHLPNRKTYIQEKMKALMPQ